MDKDKRDKKLRKLRIILDTNFLLIPARLRVDIFEEIRRIMNEPYELCVVEETINELNSLVNKGGKDGVSAKVALELIKKKGINVIKTKSFLNRTKLRSLNTALDADGVIIDTIKKEPRRFIIATQDKELKKRVKALGTRVIVLRKKTHLLIE